ncbi:MAG: cation:proton antiporter [Candidatus Nanoarchaeia archaeon]|nr:cation:proton antiporter [Candidatus Nanoarchaeia archaeon]
MVLVSNVLVDLGLIIILATALAYLAKLIKQPLIPAYILAGVILGPIGLGFVKDLDLIRSLSEIGIAFLLFLVGLEIDVKKIKKVLGISLVGGILQVVLMFFAGFFIGDLFGLETIVCVYIGLIISFSSTMIVVKLLSDKGQINTLHGRIILGILLLQDILVVFALSFLTQGELSFKVVGLALFNGLILILAVVIFSRFLLKRVFDFAARSRELIFLIAISMCFLFAILANLLHFSIAIGAFLIGVGLANLPYNHEIMGRVVSLKDFFSTIFFVSLGMQLVLIGNNLVWLLVILTLMVILLKPLIIMIISGLFGYESRTSFLTAISLGQVSEFSLLLGTLGFYMLGHISQEFFSLIIFLTVLTMILTSYLIKNSSSIYNYLAEPLKIFNRLSSKKKRLEYGTKEGNYKTVLFGCNRMGKIMLRFLNKESLIVIDHDPSIIEGLIKNRINCYYGEINNHEILKKINFSKVNLIISTIETLEDNLLMLRLIKRINSKIKVIVSADRIPDALDLYERGADYVILPHISSAESMKGILGKANLEGFNRLRSDHIKHLLDLGIEK